MRSIQRLRLTLHSGESTSGQRDIRGKTTQTDDKAVNGTLRKRNGFIRERPAGGESPVDMTERRGGLTNGASREAGPARGGPKVYGVVQRTGESQEQEVMAREWSINHLRDEMKYIKEVRDSLEKVREKMYGQFGGMQQSVEKLSREIKAESSYRRSLEAEVRVRTAAMDSFDQMNSSLISANIDLQKSLLENCNERVGKREEMRSVRSSRERAEEKLREKERQLAAAQEENRTLKRQVEVSQEASAQALRDMSNKLEQQYEQRLQEEHRKHREEIEALQAQIDNYVRRIEELEENGRIAEAKITERDQRIGELERLLDCMGREKEQLLLKLREAEGRLQQLDQMDHRHPAVNKRAGELEEEVAELRERIKHLNDMVFCQQRKVKGMIEEVQQLRSKVAQKDMFIAELLDRLAIVECESVSEKDKPQTRDFGVGCDLPEARSDPMPPSPPQPSIQPLPSYHYQPSATLPRPSRTSPTTPTSRLSNTLLRYTPVQYSQFLQDNPFPRSSSVLQDHTDGNGDSSASAHSDRSFQASSLPDPTGNEEDSPRDPPTYSPIAMTKHSRVYTPFMRLMELSAKLNTE
ncbi:myocardial zonula adherens protein isoform X2 [Alosa sapidissima]|uniref:myocardial zonula adherens protein isoform X2 n=1 Tax=Alosa sapidissima TaxID=34773 RepID=UPI001C094962|nr:myocardial zonula adherens protein isoform X2 [Alosa sapidissima]